MQRVTNCIYVKNDQILLLKKPRRGWWAIPGGKMEPKETVKDAVVREFFEETGIAIKNPILKGISTFLIEDNDAINEWMMFTFLAKEGEGVEKHLTEEGILQWQNIYDLDQLPMAEGDRFIIHHALTGNDILYGSFHYTSDYQLLSYRLDPPITLNGKA